MSRALTRRGLLAGSAALTLSACAKPPINLVTPSASPSGSVRAQLDAIMAVYGENTPRLGVALRDLRSGADFDFRATYASQSASMAKVMIAAMALRAARAQGREADFETATRISQALVNSDNDSADALWAASGGPAGYDALDRALPLPATTHADPGNTFWSWTWTTPADQRSLLAALLSGTPALTGDDRRYLLDVMGKTNPKQTWGVGHAKSREVAVAMKNGWVEFTSSDGLWAVNSLGRVHGQGRDYLACFMCRMPSFEAGRRLLDAIGADVFDILGSGTLS